MQHQLGRTRGLHAAGLSPRCLTPASHLSVVAKRFVQARSGVNVATAEGVKVHATASNKLRRMILLRHADSETSARLRDYDRPISLQGKREAANIARRLQQLGWIPDLIIASNSKRTKQTLDTMAEAAAELSQVDAHYLGSLYTVAALDGQTKHHLEETIRSVACDFKNSCIMCVGHNKGWEEAASAFAKQAVRLGTASAALFEAAGSSWEDVTVPDTDWKLVSVVTP
eukprot:GHRR01004434.1.p1 GENE.GHRR01004434.1~~GHRR01004434.1.p1  ORF type:complete len:228 (+),score=77.17 GHRR01004434.1:210-893(+)